jgi:hypothetical protein
MRMEHDIMKDVTIHCRPLRVRYGCLRLTKNIDSEKYGKKQPMMNKQDVAKYSKNKQKYL